jgi:hypothetical protein
MWGRMRRGRRHGARRGPGRTFVVALLGLAPILALGACGASTGSPGPTNSGGSIPTTAAISATPSPTPSISPTQAARRDALAAYRAMIDDWVAVAATSDYESTRLADHATGSALDLITKVVFDNARNKVVSKGRPIIAPRITETNSPAPPTRVEIVDCLDSTHWLNYKLNGELQDNIPGGRSYTEALVVPENGTWKVNELAIRDTGTC